MKNRNRNFARQIVFGALLIAMSSLMTYAQVAKDVARIQGEVSVIDKGLAKYKKVTKDVDGVSLEGTSATYYRSRGILRKIKLEMFGETYNATGQVYYKGGEPIFALIQQNRYDTQIGLAKPPKVVRREQQRFYFVNGDIVRLQVGTKILKPRDERYTELKDQIDGILKNIKP